MEASDITARSERVSSVVLAEIYHFQRERVIDFRDMMKALLQQQINFYKEVVCSLLYSSTTCTVVEYSVELCGTSTPTLFYCPLPLPLCFIVIHSLFMIQYTQYSVLLISMASYEQ